MTYIYGTVIRNGETVENLKTVGAEHSNLSGVIETKREFDDGVTITDRCRIVEHYHSDVDAGGNCYDWYVIDQHYRYIDRGDYNKAIDAVYDEMAAAYEKGVQEA